MIAISGGLLLAAAGLAALGIPAAPGIAVSIAVGLLAMVAVHAHTTLRGKFAAWAGILSGLGLKGNERVLDLGCGRGAVLLAVAKLLSTGRAVGGDIWRTSDQSGN